MPDYSRIAHMHSGDARITRREQAASLSAEEPVQPEYPGLIGSVVMLMVALPFIAGFGWLGLWGMTGWEDHYSMPLAMAATWALVAYTYYSIQPARGIRRYFALQEIPWRAAMWVPLCYLGAFLLIGGLGGLLVDLLVFLGLPEDLLSAPQVFPDGPLAMELLSVLVIAPLGEELLFRGVLLQGLLQRYSATNSVLLSAAIFGAMHDGAHQDIGAFLAGCVLGWVFVETRSLWVTILMHTSHNAFATICNKLWPKSGQRGAEPTSAPGLPNASSPEEIWMSIGLLLVSVVVGWLFFYCAYRALKRQLALATSPVPTAAASELGAALRLTDFKARRPARTSASG